LIEMRTEEAQDKSGAATFRQMKEVIEGTHTLLLFKDGPNPASFLFIFVFS